MNYYYEIKYSNLNENLEENVLFESFVVFFPAV